VTDATGELLETPARITRSASKTTIATRTMDSAGSTSALKPPIVPPHIAVSMGLASQLRTLSGITAKRTLIALGWTSLAQPGCVPPTSAMTQRALAMMSSVTSGWSAGRG